MTDLSNVTTVHLVEKMEELVDEITKKEKYVELIKEELTKRKRELEVSIRGGSSKTPAKKTSPKKTPAKKTPAKRKDPLSKVTVKHIKMILDENHVTYSKKSNKKTLTDIIREHGLVRKTVSSFEKK